jgi:tetratricopeptide (TPR) repeat protein
VLLCWSLDGSYTFNKAAMPKTGRNGYELSVILHKAERDELCAYAEVEYPDNFFLSSMPHFGPKFDVKVRRTQFGIETYRREMDTDAAIAEFKKDLADASLSLPERLTRQYNLAKFCAAVNRPVEAVELFDDIIKKGEGLAKYKLVPDALYHQASVLHDQGQDERAKANLERAIKLYPSCSGLDGKEIPRARELLAKVQQSMSKK